MRRKIISILHPSLQPIQVEIVDELTNPDRGKDLGVEKCNEVLE